MMACSQEWSLFGGVYTSLSLHEFDFIKLSVWLLFKATQSNMTLHKASIGAEKQRKVGNVLLGKNSYGAINICNWEWTNLFHVQTLHHTQYTWNLQNLTEYKIYFSTIFIVITNAINREMILFHDLKTYLTKKSKKT